jgi:CobQ-like glutamine amidotransferase family enzyme
MAMSEVHGRTLRVCALYPDLMNIYADRGNLFVLERRCSWRGIGFQLSGSGLGEPLDGEAHDIYYLGGGQDRDQLLCAEDLVAGKREALHESYTLGDEQLRGVGLLDVRTVREPGPRLIGNVAIEVDMDGSDGGRAGGPRVLAGFENHGGRTYLGPDATPLGRVLKGHGNDGHSGFEGARAGNVIGTYLHGPLLPKNTWFADWLIAIALGIDTEELAALDDTLELQAHRSARVAAGV